MSARKIETSSLDFTSVPTRCLSLSAEKVRIRKNGIEFHNEHPLTPWTEMTVTLQGPGDAKKVNFTGVIVECAGSLKDGYEICMLFTHLSRVSQARLLSYS